MLENTYISEVNNETISFVEAGPSQGDFCGSYNSPALDMQQPLSTQIISNYMIKSRGNTTCLNKTKQSSQIYFSFISAKLPFFFFPTDEELALGKKWLIQPLISQGIVLFKSAELSGVNFNQKSRSHPHSKGFHIKTAKVKAQNLQHSPASFRG